METVYVPSVDIIGWIEKIIDFLLKYLPIIFKQIMVNIPIISVPLSIMLVIGIVTAVERTHQIRKKEKEIYNPKTEVSYDENAKGDSTLTLRWKTITEHVESENPNDWRHAIMDADIILDDILDRMGYQGESIGEKLKRVEKADFQTIDEAWEAHKIRNIIAHEGSDYSLTHHEAKRVIGLYKKVFEEFYFI